MGSMSTQQNAEDAPTVMFAIPQEMREALEEANAAYADFARKSYAQWVERFKP